MLVDEFEEFLILLGYLLFGAAANGLGGAMIQMVAHERSAHTAESFLNRRDLDDDVGAVAFLFNHFLKSPNLAFNSPESFEVGSFDCGIDGYGFAALLLGATAGGVQGSDGNRGGMRLLDGHLCETVYTPTPYITIGWVSGLLGDQGFAFETHQLGFVGISLST